MIYSTIKDLFKGICDAIRSKDGTAEEINHQDIPSRIQAIQSGLDTSDATATADDILAEKTAYVNGSKVTGSMTNNGAVAKTLDTNTTSYTVPAGYHDGSGKVQVSTETKTATPTTSSQSITPSIGKVLSEVTVHAIPSQYVDTSDVESTSLDTSDATATAGDIANGKTAYVNGEKITGTIPYEDHAFKKTPAVEGYLIYFSYNSSYEKRVIGDGKQLRISSDLSNFGDASTEDVVSGKTFTSASGLKVTGTHTCEAGLDTSDATAGAGDILAGKTAYVNGVKITGSISSKAAESYTPGTADQTIAAGQYLSGAQTIKGDANLVAGNIKSGVSIFGVAGTYEGSGGASGGIQAQHITSASDTITISGSGTVKVWGYGYYSSGMYTKTTYAFVGDSYYTASSYGTPSKHSVTFGINADGTLSGFPSNVSTIDALITIGA